MGKENDGMNLIDLSFKRDAYRVELQSSLLFEHALGIAAATNRRLHVALEQPEDYWIKLRNEVSEPLRWELDYCEQHQTWKMLLQLLHTEVFDTLEQFADYAMKLEEERFIYEMLPFLGSGMEDLRRSTAQKDAEAAAEMKKVCAGHAFFPEMIDTALNTSADRLKDHLIKLLQLWKQEVAGAEDAAKEEILRRDLAAKKGWLRSVSPAETVLRAAGVEYKPEAGVSRVLLIPHVIYRPWTIEANMIDTQIFYYPVSDASMTAGGDPYEPPGQLVQLYKALGDEKRLRALKLIAEQERSLKELTEQLGMGKTTVHHHLAILRGAGLVRVKDGSYVWNKGSLDRHDHDLRDFLGLDENKP